MAAVIRSNARFRQAVFRHVSMAQSTDGRFVLLELLRQLDGEEAAVAACQLLVDPLPSELPYGIREWLEGAITSREPAGSVGAYWLRPRAANAVRRRLFELMMTDAERSRAARRALLVIENHRVRFGRPADECCHPAGAAPSTWREEFPTLRGRSWVLEGVTGSRTT
jgi:hypothetical protein